MARIAIVIGLLLMLLGVGGYLGVEPARRSPTAFIPGWVGIILAVCGVLALDPAKRKHAMHVAAAAGLIGFLLPAGRLIVKSAQGALPGGMALFSQAAMALICLVFVIMCVRSFGAARRERGQA